MGFHPDERFGGYTSARAMRRLWGTRAASTTIQVPPLGGRPRRLVARPPQSPEKSSQKPRNRSRCVPLRPYAQRDPKNGSYPGVSPMGERTSEGAKPDRTRLEGFFVRYGEVVSDGDLEAISACYAVPSIVISDEGAIPIATREEVEAAFDGAAERYRARGMVAARPPGRPSSRRRPSPRSWSPPTCGGTTSTRGGAAPSKTGAATCSGWRTWGRGSARSSRPLPVSSDRATRPLCKDRNPLGAKFAEQPFHALG